LIQRFHNAKVAGDSVVEIWGTGLPRREFMFVDDFADACVFAAQNWTDKGVLNVGTGEEIAIGEFAQVVAAVVGYKGRIDFNTSKPDGSPRKLLDVSKLAMRLVGGQRSASWRGSIGPIAGSWQT
jgi:GDP-L-fucose synthase